MMQLLTGKVKNTWIQLFRYAIVGGCAFVVDYGSLWLLTEVFHLHYLVSAVIAFILGLTCNYLLSTSWVFGDHRMSNRWAEFSVFAIIGVVGLGLNELIMYLGCEKLHLHYMVAKLISTAIVFFWNFFARKFILFNKTTKTSSE